MLRWTDPAQTPADLRPCVATIGNFDGVHRGHQAVLAALLGAARDRALPAVVLTFEPHPIAVLRPEVAPPIVAPGELRRGLLAETGIDGLLEMPFTREFAATTPEDFVREVLVEGLGVAAVVVGVDTRFGVRNSGTVDTLRELGGRFGFDVVALDDLGEGEGDRERWSSSAIRERLGEGQVGAAAAILGRPHRVRGTVVHGHHRGRELGYPTANLSPDSLGMVPAEGVYAGWLTRVDRPLDSPDRTMPCAISIGTNPTFETDGRRTVEAYVLDRTDLDLYGETVVVEFVEHIRPTLKFDSIEALLAAMADDVEACRRILGQVVPG